MEEIAVMPLSIKSTSITSLRNQAIEAG